MRIRIRELRTEHGYREQELARLLSISARLPGDALMKLSAIFGVPPEEILMEEDEADDR